MSLSISIDSANIITHSSLNIHNDNCPICRYSLMNKCLDCDSEINNHTNTNDCISVIGVCGHGYHFHCISTWLKSKIMCPLDNNKWEYKKHPDSCNCIQKKVKKNINQNNNSHSEQNNNIEFDQNSESESE